jgi:signal transduction histidine kinase
MRSRPPHWWPKDERFHPQPRRGWWLFVLIPISFFLFLGFLAGRGHGPWFLWPLGILLLIGFLSRRRSQPRWFPVSRLVDAASKLADGDYSARVEAVEGGPMREVINSFNGMATRLEESAEQRRRWLADLGHELRNPLTVIQGELEAMLDGVHEPNREQLAMLLDETELMSRLLDDLRTLSLSEAGQLRLEKEVVSLSDIVEDALAPLQDEARRRGLALSSQIQPGTIEADPLRLRAVLSNLASNAIRHAKQVVAVSAELRGDQWTVSVQDDGPGIPDDLLSHVFERFVKGSDSKGTGLGLSIAKDLVEAHLGTISVVADRGTRFTLSLPAVSR